MKCKTDNCGKSAHARGFCAVHYTRFMRKHNLYGVGRCETENCGRKAAVKGLCGAHYKRLIRQENKLRIRREKSGKKCGAGNCNRPAKTNGLCHAHYVQLWRTGILKDIQGRERNKGLECRAENCNRQERSKGLCQTHYSQLRTTGILTGIEIKAVQRNKGLECRVENCSQPAVSKGLCKTHYSRLCATGSLETKTLTSKGPWSDWARARRERVNNSADNSRYSSWQQWAKGKVGCPNFHHRNLSPRTPKPPPPDWIRWSVDEQQRRTTYTARPAKGTWEWWSYTKQKAIARRGVMINDRKSKIQTTAEAHRIAGV